MQVDEELLDEEMLLYDEDEVRLYGEGALSPYESKILVLWSSFGEDNVAFLSDDDAA